MNGEIKWTDIPRDDVVAVLNRDMIDDGTIARAREYHHALVNVATAARKFRGETSLALNYALIELGKAERAMMVAKGERS
jgi:hypothetical protein